LRVPFAEPALAGTRAEPPSIALVAMEFYRPEKLP
jgi:hypothetical protein